jgi:hyaluronoglucosaminidase
MDQGAGRLAASELGTLANRLLAAADHLLRGPVENRALIAECRPWIEAFETGAQALRQIAVLAAEGRLEKDAAELRPYLVRLRHARVRVFGDALDMTLADLTNTHVRPGELTLDAPGGGA